MYLEITMPAKESTFSLEIIEEADGSLSLDVVIDGVCFGEDIIDLKELKKSAICSGAYELQTCGCGIAGCAGFFEPIFVQHTANYIIWEFDSNYHPIPKRKDDISKEDIKTLKFNRNQYISQIKQKFEFIRNHKKRKKVEPYFNFDNKIFDESFPDLSKLHTPFEKGAILVIGYTEDFKQPFVWVENQSKLYLYQLIPKVDIWSMYRDWTSLFEEVWHKNDIENDTESVVYQLRKNVSVEECNHKIQALANELHHFWGSSVCVVCEKLPDDAAYY